MCYSTLPLRYSYVVSMLLLLCMVILIVLMYTSLFAQVQVFLVCVYLDTKLLGQWIQEQSTR